MIVSNHVNHSSIHTSGTDCRLASSKRNWSRRHASTCPLRLHFICIFFPKVFLHLFHWYPCFPTTFMALFHKAIPEDHATWTNINMKDDFLQLGNPIIRIIRHQKNSKRKYSMLSYSELNEWTPKDRIEL